MTKKKTIRLSLAAAYLGVCLLRLLLARLSAICPSLIPDEFLYYSIARSLATGNGAMLYGQAADYSFILYPFVLSAAYLFPDGTDYFFVMQGINILLINLSIFPLFALSRQVLRDERKALGIAVISVLLPDFALCQYLQSESLLFPLFFTLLLLVYQGGYRNMILAGITGGLMFAVKPGQAVPPIVMIVLSSLTQSEGSKWKKLLAGMIPMVLCASAIILITAVWINPGTTLFSLYDSQLQVENKGEALWAFTKGVLLSPFTFVFGAGILPIFAPLSRLRQYEPRERSLLNGILLTAILMLIGTAWVVNRSEPDNPTVHLRYVSMLFPALLLFTEAIPDASNQRSAVNRRKKAEPSQHKPAQFVCLILFAACVASALLFGYDGGISASAPDAFAFSLSWLKQISKSAPGHFAITLLAVGLLTAGFLMCRRCAPKPLKRAAAGCACAMLLLNNLCLYSNGITLVNQTSGGQKTMKSEAEQIRETVGDETYLYLFSTFYKRYDAALDVNTRKNISMIYINDFYNHMLQTGGVYEPFVPDKLTGDLPDRLTADTDLFLLDKDTMAKVNLSPSAKIVCAADGLTLVRIQAKERWLDSIVGGIAGDSLSAGQRAWFVNLDGQSHEHLSIDMDVCKDAEVTIGFRDGSTYAFQLPEGRDTYTLSVAGASEAFIQSDCTLVIHSFGFFD